MMPFSDELLAVYEQLIRPALDGYDVIRADTRLDERGILEKIITGIRSADLVIADITNANANVMYELGVAHTLGKATIMIAPSVDRIPFDVRAYPVHEYSTHFTRASQLKHILSELSHRHRSGELLFANPVTDFIPELRELPEAKRATESYSFDQCTLDLRSATAAIQAFGDDYGRIADHFIRGIDEAINNAIDLDDKRRRVADRIRNLARDIDTLALPLHESWELYGRATAWLLTPEQFVLFDLATRQSFAEQARSTDDSFNIILGNIANLRATNDATPRVDGNITHAIEAAHDAMTRLLNVIMTGKAHLARAIVGFAPETLTSA